MAVHKRQNSGLIITLEQLNLDPKVIIGPSLLHWTTLLIIFLCDGLSLHLKFELCLLIDTFFNVKEVFAERLDCHRSSFESLNLRYVPHFALSTAIFAIGNMLVCIDNFLHLFLWFIVKKVRQGLGGMESRDSIVLLGV